MPQSKSGPTLEQLRQEELKAQANPCFLEKPVGMGEKMQDKIAYTTGFACELTRASVALSPDLGMESALFSLGFLLLCWLLGLGITDEIKIRIMRLPLLQSLLWEDGGLSTLCFVDPKIPDW